MVADRERARARGASKAEAARLRGDPGQAGEPSLEASRRAWADTVRTTASSAGRPPRRRPQPLAGGELTDCDLLPVPAPDPAVETLAEFVEPALRRQRSRRR